jgi:hypothetical protein
MCCDAKLTKWYLPMWNILWKITHQVKLEI